MVPSLVDLTLTHFPRFAQESIRVHPLEKGGSDRKFYRIAIGTKQSLILAKYGRQREENRHYVAIARFLAQVGVRGPEIYFHDDEEGLIWMEDLGDRDLCSYRLEAWPQRRALYQDALDQLLILHTEAHQDPGVSELKLQAEFNAELYLWEQNYFWENCLGRHFGIAPETLREVAAATPLEEIARDLAALPRCLVHRDFQSQNIVVKNGAAYFIDFQGMRPGLPHYDLASLLYDPYVLWKAEERAELLAYYRGKMTPGDQRAEAEFDRTFQCCAMQRLMQALGAYGFLGHVKNRPDFLVHIPVALNSLREIVREVRGMETLSGLLVTLAA